MAQIQVIFILCRKDGLTWIIKAIWNLGFDVITSYLPNFLDESSINYLFEYTIREIELKKLRRIYETLQIKMKMSN